MERYINLDGTFNCRDIGGYRTADGHTVKCGRLLRSDSLHNLSDNDLSTLKKMGLKTVVDFRSPQEAGANPDRLPEGVRLIELSPQAELAAAASASVSTDTKARVKQLEERAATEEGRKWFKSNMDMMEGEMRRFVTQPPGIKAFGGFLKLLAQPDSDPVMFHCRGGKDRTGWAAALILSVLGVSRSVIMEDYLATAIYNAARNEKRLKEYRQLTDNPVVLDYMASLMQVKENYLSAAFEEVDRLSGIQNYLSKTIGLTERERALLIEKYLE